MIRINEFGNNCSLYLFISQTQHMYYKLKNPACIEFSAFCTLDGTIYILFHRQGTIAGLSEELPPNLYP